MTTRAVPITLLVAAIGFLGAAIVPAWAEGGHEVALAAVINRAADAL